MKKTYEDKLDEVEAAFIDVVGGIIDDCLPFYAWQTISEAAGISEERSREIVEIYNTVDLRYKNRHKI
jgi:hypothetical protein